jgi:hypothetical protein
VIPSAPPPEVLAELDAAARALSPTELFSLLSGA